VSITFNDSYLSEEENIIASRYIQKYKKYIIKVVSEYIENSLQTRRKTLKINSNI
jgi:hypothetical protein